MGRTSKQRREQRRKNVRELARTPQFEVSKVAKLMEIQLQYDELSTLTFRYISMAAG